MYLPVLRLFMIFIKTCLQRLLTPGLCESPNAVLKDWREVTFHYLITVDI